MKRSPKNTIPFLILCMIHTSLLIYTFYKRKNRKSLFILLLSNIGLAYLFEIIILNYFKAYDYKPKVIKKNYLDNIFGAILSQGVFVPFTAIFITAFGFGWNVKILFGIYFALVEKLFIRLGIFKTNGWRTSFTVVLIPIFFRISDSWYKHLRLRTNIVLSLSLYMMTMVTGINTMFIFSVSRKFRFGFGRFHSWKEHFFVEFIYSVLLSVIAVWSIRVKPNWLGFIRSFLIIKIMDWILGKKHIIKKGKNKYLFLNGIHFFILFVTMKYNEIVFHEPLKKKG